MKCLRALALVALSLPLGASVVDVSGSESVTVANGDTLSFQLLTTSYTYFAYTFGQPVSPESFQFALATMALPGGGQFTASLDAGDATASAAFGSLSVTDGYLSRSGYSGDVSVLSGTLSFADDLSAALFGSGSVWLRLKNTGASITLGIDSLLIGQDLYASLSGGFLTVGAISSAVTLQHDTSSVLLLGGGGPVRFDSSVPEPAPAALIFSGMGAIAAIFLVRRRASQARQNSR